MVIVEAVYQKGIIKPKQHLNLPDNTRVQVRIIPSDKILAENRLKQRLVELGMIQEAKGVPNANEEDRTPIEVKGKPLSETIIEERR